MKTIEHIDKYKEAQKDDFASLGLFNNIYDKLNEMINVINELNQRIKFFEDAEEYRRKGLEEQFREQSKNH